MSRQNIPERAWKTLRAMKDEKLDIARTRIFEKVEKLLKDESKSTHKRYLSLWQTMRNEDREISRMFDDLKRSNAINMLVAWRQNGLLTDNESSKFSEGTRKSIVAECALFS